ncbi:MAG: cbiC, partial [Deltaproteobacteria bacterium]|nr:cbiC [Deltaproteobacteria bacterium]
MSVHLRPEEIEAESFRLIDAEAGPHGWSAAEWPVVRRVIHTSADFDYLRTMVMSPGAVAAGVRALKAGRGIVTDTTMALAGINKPRLVKYSVPLSCFVADAAVAREASAQGITRSILAMRRG